MTEENETTTNYSTKSEFNKPAIADFAVRKVIDLRAKEMKKGYFNEQLTKEGDIVRTYIEDTRKTFINGVQALKSLLEPEIRSIKELKEFVEEVTKKDEELFKKYSVRQWEVKEGTLKAYGEPYIPEVDDYVLVTNFSNPNQRFKEIKGYWNSRVATYWWKRLKLYDSLFAELNVLTAKVHYFKSSASF